MFHHQEPVEVKTKHIKQERLDVEYPVVEGLASKSAETYINAVIYGIIDAELTNIGYYENPMTDITGKYHIRSNEKGVLSISLEIYWFSGGAHGMTELISITFDVKTGRIYRLEDVFKPGSDYVRRLSDIIKRQIVEKDIPVIVEFNSIQPDQDFYIEGRKLVIYFQLYELAPYAYGFPTFSIPYREIEDILRKDGPLGRLWRGEPGVYEH